MEAAPAKIDSSDLSGYLSIFQSTVSQKLPGSADHRRPSPSSSTRDGSSSEEEHTLDDVRYVSPVSSTATSPVVTTVSPASFTDVSKRTSDITYCAPPPGLENMAQMNPAFDLLQSEHVKQVVVIRPKDVLPPMSSGEDVFGSNGGHETQFANPIKFARWVGKGCGGEEPGRAALLVSWRDAKLSIKAITEARCKQGQPAFGVIMILVSAKKDAYSASKWLADPLNTLGLGVPVFVHSWTLGPILSSR